MRPGFASFVIAFIVAAMQWTGHRDLFTLIRYTDRGIIWLNLLTLFAVCLLPFGSALLSRYYEDPRSVPCQRCSAKWTRWRGWWFVPY